jgi:hypothetical protein
LRNTNSPKLPLRELENDSETGFFLFVFGIVSRNFEYFLITNQVKSVVKDILPKTRRVTRFRFIFYIFTNGVAAGFLLIII